MIPRYVAILEDEPRRQHAMTQKLSRLMPDARIAMFDSAIRMIDWLDAHLPEVVLFSLDHDLPVVRNDAGDLVDYGDGRQVAAYLSTRPPTAPVIVHSSNALASHQMIATLRSAGWPVHQTPPHDDLAWIDGDWEPLIARLKQQRWFAEAG